MRPGAGSCERRAWLRGGVAASVLVLCAPLGFAQDRSSPIQFMLDQQGRSPARRSSSRAAVRAHPRPTTERTAAAKPVQKPGFIVAVFGDAFAASIARGLAETADTTAADLFDATSDSNGLSQDRVSDWSTAVAAVMADRGHIDAAVIGLGGADLRAFVADDGTRVEFGTPDWRVRYGDRVQQLADQFRDRHVTLIWVGLPVVRDDLTASRYADLNAIVRDRARAGGAVYIDSWEAFVDDNGQYAPTGPDVSGQTAKLRHNDGLGFTAAGAAKLASFVAVELRPLEDRVESTHRIAAVTDDRTIFDEALQIDVNAQIRREAGLGPAAASASTATAEAGPVVLLTAPPIAAGGQLVTLAQAPRPSDRVDAVLVRGLTPPPQPGRTDDFAWPRP